MRAIIASSVLSLLAACEPDIVQGAYLCGPEQLCPEGQVCNGPDNACVLPEAREPFACEADPENLPTADNTPATGHVIPNLTCVSVGADLSGCLDLGDAVDWVQFDVPTGCTAVAVVGRVTFPIAFQRLGLRIARENGTPTAIESDCDPGTVAGAGLEGRCYEMVLEPGGRYAIGVEREGDDCDGACPYNRYRLELRLKTP